tara:strand:- start:364 stop:786 length:423 start_codon:yes stop_codon:yes gene_type:complete
MKTPRQQGEGSFASFSRSQLIEHIRMQQDLITTLKGSVQPLVVKTVQTVENGRYRAVYDYLSKHHGKSLKSRVAQYGHANVSTRIASETLRKRAMFTTARDVYDCLNQMESKGYIRFIYDTSFKGDKRIEALAKLTQVVE